MNFRLVHVQQQAQVSAFGLYRCSILVDLIFFFFLQQEMINWLFSIRSERNFSFWSSFSLQFTEGKTPYSFPLILKQAEIGVSWRWAMLDCFR